MKRKNKVSEYGSVGEGEQAAWSVGEMGSGGDGEKPRTVVRQKKRPVLRHTDSDIYQRAFRAAMELFKLTRKFPAEERYSLTDQMRRSSRSVCANFSEAWRKRRYRAAFVSKLSDAESEAAETQVWIQFAVECGYLDRVATRRLYSDYDDILGMLVSLINNPTPWLLD